MKFSPDVKRLNPHLKDSEFVTARITTSAKSKRLKRDTADDLYTVWERHANVRAPFPQREFVFAESRACRFDFAWPRNRQGGGLAVEMDGGQHLARGGRHNTDSDRAKLNLAGELGWIVMRYTPDMLAKDPIGIVEQIERTLINLKLWKLE